MNQLRILLCSAFVVAFAACPGDTGSTFPCCTDGEVSECDCPPDAICDPVPFEDCGDGTCVIEEDGQCETGDAGAG